MARQEPHPWGGGVAKRPLTSPPPPTLLEQSSPSPELCLFARLSLPLPEDDKGLQQSETWGRCAPLVCMEAVPPSTVCRPMYEKYNTVLRSASGNAYLVGKNKSLCQGNTYVTTIHAINSCVLKLSKLMDVCAIWRGMTRGQLPDGFWTPNRHGTCGGVEYGFSSTTAERAQALHYAQGVASTVFEMRQGMIDRGADFSWLSQYPFEREILYPPLLGIEATGSRVDKTTLVIDARLSLNMMSETLDEVLTKRFRLLKGLCDNIKLEIERALGGALWKVLCGNPLPPFLLFEIQRQGHCLIFKF